MAGFLENIMQGYINKMSGNKSGNNDALAAQNSASAYQRLQDAIAQDYDQQKQNAQANGQEWSMPSPTERMQDQVQAMILSGDPNLQARGLAMLDVPKEDDQTNLEKTAKLLNLTPMQVFDKLHPGAAQTHVNVNLPKQDQPMTFEDAQKLDWGNVPGGYQPGMSMMDAGRAGARLAATKDQAEAAATSQTVENAAGRMNEASQSTTPGGLPGMIAEGRNLPGLVGQGINMAANAARIPRNAADTQFVTARNTLSSYVSKQLNGASATDADIARIENMMPSLADDAATRQVKTQNVLAAVQNVVSSAKNKGGNIAPGVPSAPKAPTAPKAPQTRTTKSGLTYTVEH